MKYGNRILGLGAAMVLFLTTTAVAQSDSVAVTDGYDAAVINPAALSVGNAMGIAGELGYTRDAFMESRIPTDSWSIFLSGRHLAYAYEELPQSGRHTITGSTRIVPGFHTGAAYRWTPGGFTTGNVRLGALYRPSDAVSAGATVTFVDANSATGVLGLGFRPFYFLPDDAHRLTLSSDFPYDGTEWTNPRIGIGAEPIDGLTVDVGYEIETGRFRGAVSVALSSLRAGNRTRFDTDNDIDSGTVFLHLSPRRFRPIAAPRDNTFVDYSPGPVVVERRNLPDVWPVTGFDNTVSVLDVAGEIRRLAGDKTVVGILFRKHLFSASSANMLEIKAALQEFRASGKYVVFYFEGVDNWNYALAASSADRIFLHPGGFVQLTGEHVTRPYLAEFLATIGVEVRNYTSGEYKNLGNIYSERAMPESEREAWEYLLDDLYGVFLRSIEEGRGNRLTMPVQETVDAGPYLIARDALDAGLVDRLIYEDEISDALEELTDRPRVKSWERREDIRYSWAETSGARVALIYVTGPITTGGGRPGEIAGSDSIADAIRRAREDGSVQAILLRVASGGGSSLASETIAREIQLTRTGDDPKPVVVSMGGTAASGGYYVSAWADEIIAQPTTLTGSIGAVALVPNIVGLSSRLGINWETIRRGERADLGAIYRVPEPAEEQLLQDSIDAVYHRFVTTVADARLMSEEEVHEIARGRVWTGTQAKERGLVDTLGGMYTAIGVLEEKLGRRVELVEFTGRGVVFGTPISGPIPGSMIARNRLPPVLSELAETARILEIFGDERVLYLAPFLPAR